MADLNNVNFTGRLTKDAAKKTLPTGTNLVTFSIANNTGWGNYAKTLYLECNLWGKQGDSILQYLKKGKPVAVTGSIEQQEWTSAQDGETHRKLVVNCKDCILLSDGKGGSVEADVVDDPRGGKWQTGLGDDDGPETTF